MACLLASLFFLIFLSHASKAQSPDLFKSVGAEFGFTSTNLLGSAADYGATQYRLLTRQTLSNTITGELGVGIGIISGIDRQARYVPIEYRIFYPLNAHFKFLKSAPALSVYGGLGLTYFKRLAVGVQGHPFLVESDPAITESALWSHGSGWSFLVPVGLEMRLAMGSSHALTAKVGYNLVSGEVQQQQQNGLDGFWGASLGVNIRPVSPKSAEPEEGRFDLPISTREYSTGVARELSREKFMPTSRNLKVSELEAQPVLSYGQSPTLCYETLHYTFPEAGRAAYTVQLGAFALRENADAFAGAIKRKYAVAAHTVFDSKQQLYKVRLDPFKNLTDANRQRTRLQSGTGPNRAFVEFGCRRKAEGNGSGLHLADRVLQQLVAMLQVDPELRLRVRGYADKSGHAVMNQSLSFARSWEVKRALIERGVDPARIQAVGYGEENPEAIETGRQNALAENRRVEIELLSGRKAPVEPETTIDLPEIPGFPGEDRLLIPSNALVFEPYSDALSDVALGWLAAMAVHLREHPSISIRVQAYNGPGGSELLNRMLAYARMARVVDFLLVRGVEYDRIQMASATDVQNEAQTKETGGAKNPPRVEITVTE
jgi:outer membrane protein OmpA-like peptidoglycan-associated protein